MTHREKVTAIIPARGGSKGLPGKNIREFAGKPLIAWTIEQAIKSDYIDNVVVSTDDKKIASIAEHYGAEVPFLRPRNLAKDDTSTFDVVFHLLEHLKQTVKHVPRLVVLLQPTSPLRATKDINRALRMLVSNKEADAVVGLTEVSKNPYWMKEVTDEGFIADFIPQTKRCHRRQDLPLVYTPNGAIYVCKTDALLREKTFFPKKALGCIMPKERSVDIDDIIDFKFAETIMKNTVKC